MEPVITARHCEISDALRARARTIVDRVEHLSGRPMETTVVFGVDAGLHVVELRLHVGRGDVFVATADGPDHRTALDQAEERLKTQVRKAAGRARDGRHSAEFRQV